jgi:hypothetical protein
MRRWRWLRNKWVLLTVALTAGGAVVLWLHWTSLLAWYYVRGLSRANDAGRGRWVQLVASLNEAALPGLLDCLGRGDARVCANAGAALACLVSRWGPHDPRTSALAARLADAFPTRSQAGMLQILELQGDLLVQQSVPKSSRAGLVRAAGRVLAEASRSRSHEIQAQALFVADLLVDASPGPELIAVLHDLTRTALLAADVGNRTRAIHLARSKVLGDRPDLLELLVPSLRDPEPRVRREALQALALKKYPSSQEYLISDDDLLSWLHDPDKQVQHWCEKALRARNHSDLEIQMARLVTDERVHERLKVFEYLKQSRYETPDVWIARLCDDPEPSVKIAAARAAQEHHSAGLLDRIREMAETDPSGTVRQTAAYYFKMMQHNR